MNRQDAYKLLTTYLKNPNLIKHSISCEAGMRGVYNHLYKDKSSFAKATADTWGITGLLHDIDYELAKEQNRLSEHGLLIFEKVLPAGRQDQHIPESIAHAIKSHNYENTKIMPESDMDWAIAAVDQLTGLIIASALIHADKKLHSIDPDFVLNRFKQLSFAKGANRASIKLCEEKLDIPLVEFIKVVLTAMQEIHDDLGL